MNISDIAFWAAVILIVLVFVSADNGGPGDSHGP